MNPIYFIDLEGFQHGEGRMIMKELCIINIENPLGPLHYIFMAPKSLDELSEAEKIGFHYQTSRLHHLKWYEGLTRYCQNCTWHTITHVFPYWAEGTFYVMDKINGTKIKFLQEEFPHLNLIAYNTVIFKNLPPLAEYEGCKYRDHGKHCAFRKCIQLYHHYNSQN